MEAIHPVDRQIIELLQADGRMSFVDMAARIGVTEGTIRRRFNQLKEAGLIRIAAIADPFAVGFETAAFFGLRVDTADIENVLHDLVRLPEIHYVAAATGEYDVVARAFFANNQELADFLLHKLSRIRGIREINSSLLLRIYKRSYTWGVALPSSRA
ncbi:MAG: Lrp/AsnC family transcriptional regulator [Bacillota bacterium]|nr:Lrp/AsnC family transcriptional regulator [Bacillota bacterium]